MTLFKWLRRERLTITTGHTSPTPSVDEPAPVGTIRTEEYKRDLAEFQARRSAGSRELPDTPIKKKCGRHSLPVSCTNCTGDPDTTFNYEKKSAMKYKKKSNKRVRNSHSEEKLYEGAPNIQFLFQNQVFMPGNKFTSYSEPRKAHACQKSPDFLVQKQIDFKDDQPLSPPLFYKNNGLPFDSNNFIEIARTDEEVVDGVTTAGDVKDPSHGSGSHKNDSCDEKLWEVMSELKHFDKWADEQLQTPSSNSKSDDSRCDMSAFGLPIASACNLDVTIENNVSWSLGKWGVVPVQIKRLTGVTIDHVRKKRNMEINILRKFRHPNIILLMGIYPDVQNNIHLICERCVGSLYGILHVQGRILSVQTSVHYTLDIANALVFLHMQGYLHTALTSRSIMITAQDTAKLADLKPCTRLPKTERIDKGYDQYSPEPQYINLTDNHTSTSESEPLLTQRSDTNMISKPYTLYSEMEHYNWQAPELFESDDGLVHPCSKSDVYSLCIILWECCNASVPWKSLSYAKLKELYTLWRTGLQLPLDGSYPGSVLALLQRGLLLPRQRRQPLEELRDALQRAQDDLDEIDYIILPAKKKKSSFSTQPWDTTSPTDSDCQSPKNLEHTAVIHTLHPRDSSTESEKETSQNDTIFRTNLTSFTTEKCFISDEDDKILKYDHLRNKDYNNSACSTPLAKLRARIRDIESPGTLHRSDSTEYCSIVSPDTRLTNFGLNDDSGKDQSTERPTAKLSRSFTPKSYKPLHIKVPEFNLDSIKTILKDQSNERSSYNFDIKNYSLPSTPIARSNKLRKNAWLSGDVNANRSPAMQKFSDEVIIQSPEESESKQSTNTNSTNSPINKVDKSEELSSYQLVRNEVASCEGDVARDNYTGLRRIPDPPHDFLPESIATLERARSLNCMQSIKYKIEDELLANVNVKPLVAIHEKWIYEANKKNGRSMSMPEDNRCKGQAVKLGDGLQKSLSQLYSGSSEAKTQHPTSLSKIDSHWDQYCEARDAIAKSMNFHPIDTNTYKRAAEKGTITDDIIPKEPKIDRSTDTLSIEDFIRDLIRKEFQHMMNEMSENVSEPSRSKSDEFLNKGVANIMESLNNNEDPDSTLKKEPVKSYSTIKINGNNKPLLQITFSRSGDNNLQVLDNCVHVSISDSNTGKDKLNISMEDNLTGEEIHINSLKRCQAFSAIQEARSTEDLYIDDDLSTHMQENFGKVKLIPLHGSLHEILCDKDDCCLIKLKQENGCDTIYFRCDNSDTESRDAVDGPDRHTDTVVYKRSISLVEERIQRVCPQKRLLRRKINDKLNVRPKSEIFIKSINKDTRSRSNSSPSLSVKDRNDEVELNIENVMCYQDSSSDECLKCTMDDFETLEREIEEDLANSNLTAMTCGCLEKISEENLSTINEDVTDKN